VRLRQGAVGHVRVEIRVAMRATMLRVGDVDVAWATGHEVSHIVEDSCPSAVAETGLVTTITDTFTGDRCPATSYKAREITGYDGDGWFGPKNSPRHRWIEGGTLPGDARQASAAGHQLETSTWAALHHDW